jgi:hypothetical protein
MHAIARMVITEKQRQQLIVPPPPLDDGTVNQQRPSTNRRIFSTFQPTTFNIYQVNLVSLRFLCCSLHCFLLPTVKNTTTNNTTNNTNNNTNSKKEQKVTPNEKQ